MLLGTTGGFGVVERFEARPMDRLVLGTVNLPNVPGEGPLKLLDDAYERGFCRFDLARTYGAGKSEVIFGKWMKERNIDRDTIQIVTKGGMGNDKYGNPDREKCTYESLSGELSTSLKSLQTDHANLYMLHRDDLRIPVENFVDWMDDLKCKGYIQRWGVSNWSLRRVHEAYNYAIENGKEPPTATSPQLSLAVPSNDVWPSTHSLSCPSKIKEIEWYKNHGVEVMGWEALAKGFMAVPTLWRPHEIHMSTFHGPEGELGSDLWRLQRIQRAYCTIQNYERRKIALHIAKEAGLSLAQVALLYSLAKGSHVSVLVGADRTTHLDEMAAIRDWCLDEEAIDYLTAASTKRTLVSKVKSELNSWSLNAKKLSYTTSAASASNDFVDLQPFDYTVFEQKIENKTDTNSMALA